ncbi:hypothetical protein Cgig2_024298 [Carnegiea gigantea]|uniref:PB1 domain-containing protein n=1 Tax=Carnegiea gigantea TaxID=171969 RepID=A0A9Q1GRK1_9CARY|nr:hypothetical protein Cgig2_024298 [Carnegiea gigantea]
MGYKVLVAGILTSNGCECCSSWRRWQGKGDSYVCFMGGMLVETRDGKVTYEGRSRKCMVVRKGMGAKELLKMVREMTGSDMSEEKLWYSLKYDREMLVAVEGDNDVQVIFKGNDEHGYMYIVENTGPMRRPHTRAALCESRVRDIGEGKQIARSGGKCNDGEEVGEERGNNEAGGKRSLGVEGGELLASRLHLGRDTIEMSDDDEISVASEDTGLQFIMYPRPAAKIPPNLQAHTHCAGVLYHGRHYTKFGFTSVFPIEIPHTYVSTTPPYMLGTHTVT